MSITEIMCLVRLLCLCCAIDRLWRYNLLHNRVAGKRLNQPRQGFHLVHVHAGVCHTSHPHQHLLLVGGGTAARRGAIQHVIGVSEPKTVKPQSNSHGSCRHHSLRRLLAAVLGLPGLNYA